MLHTLNETAFEMALDRRVQGRLQTDRDYLWAGNAEEQSLAERKIELQEERGLLCAGGSQSEHIFRRIEDIDIELEEVYAELRALAN